MNKYFKKSTKRSVISILSIAITLCLLFSLLFPGKAVNAAPRMRLNKTAVTLIQGKTVKLRVIGTKRKVTWKSSNKKIAKVNKKGVVKALSPGKCTITAKVRGKKLKVYTHSVNGTISTLYDGKSQGLFLTECYNGADSDEAYDDVETSVPYKGKPRPDDIIKGIYRINDAFANYNILLKKYGYSMKKIGFTKWKNTNN